MRAAVVNKVTGAVENVIVLPGNDEEMAKHGEYRPPEGCDIIMSDLASPGDVWDGKDFIDPDGGRKKSIPFDPDAER